MVLGYEPFKDTFNEAQANIALNVGLASKIKPFNLGVSSASEKRYVSRPESGLLSASTMTTQAGAAGAVQVDLISIENLFGGVRDQFPKNPILLKVDCEGEEYGIFEQLHNADLLKNVEIAIVEWHRKGPEPVLRTLKLQGFNVMSRTHQHEESGLLYAFKTRDR
jgi:FkbM family methyltransferase